MIETKKRVQALKKEPLRPRELIRRAMEASGCITQAAAARKIGVTEPTFAVIIRGAITPTMEQAEGIAARLLEESTGNADGIP